MRAFAREFSFGDSTYYTFIVCMNAKSGMMQRGDVLKPEQELSQGTHKELGLL